MQENIAPNSVKSPTPLHSFYNQQTKEVSVPPPPPNPSKSKYEAH